MRQTQLFVEPKHFEWLKPEITAAVKAIDDSVVFMISSNVFAKAVEIDFAHHDVIFNDNYFDLTDLNKYVITAKTAYSAEELLADMTIWSVYDIR